MRSRPMPTAPDWAISGSSSGSSRLACSSTASPSSVSAGRRRSLAKRCRSRANAVTARRAVGQRRGDRGSAPRFRPSRPPPRGRRAGSHAPDRRRPAPPARPARAASPRCGLRRRPPRSPRRPAATGSSNAASDGRSDSLISTAPSGRPAKLRNGDRVRLRTRRRPISRTSSARRCRPARSSAGMPGSACARIAPAIASASATTAVSAETRVSSMRRRTPRIRRDGPSMRM